MTSLGAAMIIQGLLVALVIAAIRYHAKNWLFWHSMRGKTRSPMWPKR